MKGNFTIIYLCLLLFANQHAFGQDTHFSQVFNSPLTLNPAETGNFDGDWRVVANYRDQWRSINTPFRTLSASYDRQFYINKHHISGGLCLVNDNSNHAALITNKIYFSGSYHRTINNNYFTGGLQVGYVLNKLNFNNISFPGNWDNETGTFIPGFGSVVSLDNDLSSYLDINVGLLWKRKIQIFEPQVGVAFHHLNNPRKSFNNDNNSRIPIASSFSASIKTNVKESLFVTPGFMVNTLLGSRDFLMGGSVGMAIPGNQFNIREVQGGFYVRNGLTKTVDAMIFMFGAQVSNFQFQMSYDINVSPLNQFTNKRGAFEISIIYKSLSTIIKTFTIPCERI